MATDTTEEFTAKSTTMFEDEQAALAAAHAQALAEISRIKEKAAATVADESSNEEYSMHEAPKIGRYVIPRRTGWKALLDIIHDPVPNIDFSANVYPAFDGVIGEHFQSPYLLDPLNDKYEARQIIGHHPGRKVWEDLRDNIAAVRNFLLQQYYASPTNSMSGEQAQQALGEIAAYVGDGLYNNWLFLGIIPNHNPTKPFIDLQKAQAPHGEGAQYLYEKILEHQRQSNWMKPFTAVMALFGGNPAPDWQLLPASDTHFTDTTIRDLKAEAGAVSDGTAAELARAQGALVAIEGQLQATRDARLLSITATDLDAIGNHLVYTASHVDSKHIAQLAEPARRDAVEAAREILKKLKFSIGERQTVDGLQMKPSDDMAMLGATKGVAMVYERLVAWARANNDSEIFRHPAVMAATQAIGQMGYQAKLEGLRIAELAGNYELAKNITQHIERLPAAYRPNAGVRFGDLMESIEQGMITILARTQQVGVDGTKVGFSLDGHGDQGVPTAGISQQAGPENAAHRNAQAAQADQLAAHAEAQRIHAQIAAQARQQQAPRPQQQQAQATVQSAAPPRGATVGRQAVQSARAQQRQTSSITMNPTGAPLSASQQQASARHATAVAIAAARDRDRAQREAEQKATQQQVRNTQQYQQQKAAAKAAVAKIDTALLKTIQSATDMRGVTGATITGGRKIDPKSVQASMNRTSVSPKPAAAKPVNAEEEQQRLNQPAQTPQGPSRPGGRGF